MIEKLGAFLVFRLFCGFQTFFDSKLSSFSTSFYVFEQENIDEGMRHEWKLYWNYIQSHCCVYTQGIHTRHQGRWKHKVVTYKANFSQNYIMLAFSCSAREIMVIARKGMIWFLLIFYQVDKGSLPWKIPFELIQNAELLYITLTSIKLKANE